MGACSLSPSAKRWHEALGLSWHRKRIWKRLSAHLLPVLPSGAPAAACRNGDFSSANIRSEAFKDRWDLGEQWQQHAEQGLWRTRGKADWGTKCAQKMKTFHIWFLERFWRAEKETCLQIWIIPLRYWNSPFYVELQWLPENPCFSSLLYCHHCTTTHNPSDCQLWSYAFFFSRKQ